MMARADNDIVPGITKIRSYLMPVKHHRNPYNSDSPAPYMYFSDSLQFAEEEFGSYFWAKDSAGEAVDKPIDKNDHALDAIRYALTARPKLAELQKSHGRGMLPVWMTMGWTEAEDEQVKRSRRHG